MSKIRNMGINDKRDFRHNCYVATPYCQSTTINATILLQIVASGAIFKTEYIYLIPFSEIG